LEDQQGGFSAGDRNNEGLDLFFESLDGVEEQSSGTTGENEKDCNNDVVPVPNGSQPSEVAPTAAKEDDDSDLEDFFQSL
jgi:hypothetical protein